MMATAIGSSRSTRMYCSGMRSIPAFHNPLTTGEYMLIAARMAPLGRPIP
jgi:hypothetical protein